MGGPTVQIIDSGARGHVLAEAYARSGAGKVILAANNPLAKRLIEKEFDIEVVLDKVDMKDVLGHIVTAHRNKADLVDVAQDDALGLGTVDELQKQGIAAFGASKDAARIEYSKVWSRLFQTDCKIPTPNYSVCDEARGLVLLPALYASNPNAFFAVKADGSAAGKGVILVHSEEEARNAVLEMSTFKEAGTQFLIEDGLFGEEFSGYAIADGKNYRMFRKFAQDHKKANEGDKGPNTGGMGAYAPIRVTHGIEEEIEELLVRSAIDGLRDAKCPFTGILYVSGIKTDNGLFIIEYNARWGDPEVQTILPGLKSNYLDLVQASLDGKLANFSLEEDDNVRVCFIGASKGYPGSYKDVTGKQIHGLEEVMRMPGIRVYGSGITEVDGNFYSNGGRLFSVVAEASTVTEAQEIGREAMKQIYIGSRDNNLLHHRRDIGWRDVERELNNERKDGIYAVNVTVVG